MSMGGSVKQDTTASDTQAKISREQWDLWKEKFAPQVDSLISYINDPDMVQNNVDAATGAVGASYDAAGGSTARAAERYGLNVSPEEKAALDKERAITKSLDLTRTANDTRIAADARRDAVQNGLFALGQGVAGSAQNGWGTAAQMQATRNSANSASAASAASSNASLAGAGLGLAAAIKI